MKKLILFNKGLSLGPELITNGDFSTDTNWVKGTNVTISGGTANLSNTPALENCLIQTSVFELTKYYQIKFEISDYVEGSIYILRPTDQGTGSSVDANGTFTFNVVASASTALILRTVEETTLKIDNVSVKEIL